MYRFIFLVLFIFSSLLVNSYADQEGVLKRATFSMYCYWTGEATLGTLKGVKKTKIGSLNHNEVVEAFYDPKETNLAEMVDALKKQKSFYSVVYRTPEEKKDSLSSLSSSEVKSATGEIRYIEAKHSLKVRYPKIFALPLAEEQALRLNSWAHFGGPRPNVLSSSQEKQLR